MSRDRDLIFLIALVSFTVFANSGFGLTRLITTSPSITELVFQLGHGDKIVAASQLSHYPEKAKSLPHIGNLFQPSIELITKYGPDWILIDSESCPPDFENELRNLKLNSTRISIKSVNELFTESKRILETVFKQSDFSEIKKREIEFLNQMRKRASSFSFLALAWPSPAVLMGHSTFISDLLTISGGKNILPKSVESAYPQVSDDWLMKTQPEILFILTNHAQQYDEARQLSNRWWPNNQVKLVFLPSDQFARTSFSPLDNLENIWRQIK